MIQPTQLFWHIFLVLKVSLVGFFKQVNADTSLPSEYGSFRLQKVIKTFPCGIGIYRDANDREILIKTWRGSVQTYEYYQLAKEVRLYELLHCVLARLGSSLEGKYERVRIPRMLEKKISPTHIMAVFEYVQDSKHLVDVISPVEKAQIYELATSFWRYLGSHLTPSERLELPRRSLFATLFTYGVVLVYACLRYPRHMPALMRTLPIVWRAIPTLSANWREELVHRDFHFENILVDGEHVTIIDFGDNALTHPLQVFTNSLHWEWDNHASREIILKTIVSLCGKSQATDKVFRALFAISAVQLLHDTDSPERLKLNFRCFSAVLDEWHGISAVLGGDATYSRPALARLTTKDRLIPLLRKIRAPITRFLKPLSRYVLLTRGPSLQPLSTKYGFDRGTPIDRYYIDKFLNENKQLIHGRCLEVHDNFYTVTFGEDRVTKSDVLDIHTENKIATIYGNLKNIPQVEENTFDCIILTQTLGMIDDCGAAIRECYRVLKPGGNLLFTSKAMGPVFDLEGSYWKFTTAGIRYLFGSSFDIEKLNIRSYGNILSGQAFWVGMAAEELTTEELDHNDPRYEIIIAAVAKK